MPGTKHRLQFDVTEEAFQELEKLRESTGLPNRAEVVRHALRFLQWILEETQEGATLLIKKKDGEVREVVFPFWNAPCDPQEQGDGSGEGSGDGSGDGSGG